jgi:hypothetical protein
MSKISDLNSQLEEMNNLRTSKGDSEKFKKQV